MVFVTCGLVLWIEVVAQHANDCTKVFLIARDNVHVLSGRTEAAFRSSAQGQAESAVVRC